MFSHAAIIAMRRLFVRVNAPLSVARYSFGQASELGQSGENDFEQASKRQQVNLNCWSNQLSTPQIVWGKVEM